MAQIVNNWPGPAAAARQRGYAINYVYQLIWTGKIRAEKIGKTWFIDPVSLEAYGKRGE